jgi:hypothetical protein
LGDENYGYEKKTKDLGDEANNLSYEASSVGCEIIWVI